MHSAHYDPDECKYIEREVCQKHRNFCWGQLDRYKGHLRSTSFI